MSKHSNYDILDGLDRCQRELAAIGLCALDGPLPECLRESGLRCREERRRLLVELDKRIAAGEREINGERR